MTPDDVVGQVEIFDEGLELPAIAGGDLATEDGGELRRLPDGAGRIEESVAERVEGGAALKNQVVAVLDLRDKQPMPHHAEFGRREDGRERAEPLLRTAGQLMRCERVRELPNRIGILQALATRQDKPMTAATGSWQYPASSSVRSRSRTTVRRASAAKQTARTNQGRCPSLVFALSMGYQGQRPWLVIEAEL